MTRAFITTQIQRDQKKRWAYYDLEIMFRSTTCLIESNIVAFSRSNFRFCSQSNIRNACLLTGTLRNVFTKYKISRHAIRKSVTSGVVYGCKKSIW